MDIKKQILKKSKLYKDFHGKESKFLDEIDIGNCQVLVDLGKAISIEYEAKKKHLGDKHNQIYRHTFKKGVRVYWNGKSLIITGGKLDVEERGIIN